MVEDTRINIMKQAIKLMAKQGVVETSTNDIVKASKVTKGALYHHFDSKDKLLLELVRYVNLTYSPDKILDVTQLTKANYKKRILSFMDYSQDLKKKHPEIYNFTWEFTLYARRHPKLLKSFHKEDSMDLFAKFIEKGFELDAFNTKYTKLQIMSKLLMMLKATEFFQAFHVETFNYKDMWKITVNEVCK